MTGEFETKTYQAISLWNQGLIKEAMRLFSSFRVGITQEEKDTLKTYYECLTGKEQFYKDLDVDIERIAVEAHEIVEEKWIQFEDQPLC